MYFYRKIHTFTPFSSSKAVYAYSIDPFIFNMVYVPRKIKKEKRFSERKRMLESTKYEELVAQFEPMIFHLIKKLAIYKNKEEFYQIGLISIWQAWDKFQPQKGKYSSFLYQHMRGRFLDELKRNTKDDEQKCYL